VRGVGSGDAAGVKRGGAQPETDIERKVGVEQDAGVGRETGVERDVSVTREAGAKRKVGVEQDAGVGRETGVERDVSVTRNGGAKRKVGVERQRRVGAEAPLVKRLPSFSGAACRLRRAAHLPGIRRIGNPGGQQHRQVNRPKHQCYRESLSWGHVRKRQCNHL
jgi:hypothetical protein